MDEKVSSIASSGQPSASDQAGPGPQRDVDAAAARAAVVRRVDTGPADQGVGPGPADQRVVSDAAVERVIAPAAPEQVISRPALRLVVTRGSSLADARRGDAVPPELPAEVVLQQGAHAPGGSLPASEAFSRPVGPSNQLAGRADPQPVGLEVQLETGSAASHQFAVGLLMWSLPGTPPVCSPGEQLGP